MAGFIGSPAMNFLPVELTGTGESAVLRGDGVEMPLPGHFREAVGAASARRFTVGIRPEHLDVAPTGGASATVQARADVVEYLGNEELLHVGIAGADVVAIVSADRRVRPDDVVTVHIPLDKIHLFDAESELSLPRSACQLRRRRPAAAIRAPDADRAAAGGRSPAAASASAPGDDNRAMPDPDRPPTPSPSASSRPSSSTAAACSNSGWTPWSAPTGGARGGTWPRTRVPWRSWPSTPRIASSSCASTATRRDGPSSRSRPGRWTATRPRARSRIPTWPPGASWRRRRGTGPRTWERLTDFWTAPGFATERMFLYLATDLAPAGPDRLAPDEDEALELVRLPWREALAAAERGEIGDAKSLVGILWLARRMEAAPAG